ncbi:MULTISPECIES: diadenylate cyclase [Thermococcus]|uniref:Diadenylate cyclase n=1 Tax=Thermococcus aciditolerans TaxID=2598455 RepID=A0A5C0SQS6_9EURY|nr:MULTISPECIES: diadenylate cyclase [Thermococcus]NJE00841.1 diadenylate cyclase [Thermococcus sp. JdF3]QEK15724.1 diadenylate cyclase [Thermococcus aciditolerans]
MGREIPEVLINSAIGIVRELGGKALVILEDIDPERLRDAGVTIVIVGSSFDVEEEMVKRVSIPQNLDLNNILNLISAFLIEHDILGEGESFVYVTREMIGIKTVKKNISAMRGFFAQNQSVLQRLLEITIELSVEGREGTPVGTIFVIGDTRRVLRHSHQLIPNPFKGHRVNVLDRDSKEIIKEFAQLDGAFIVRDDGRIAAAGRYLEVEPKVIDLMLPPGLGSRHIAAAGITKLTKAMAISLSESGTIRIFKNGLMLLEYNPRIRY